MEDMIVILRELLGPEMDVHARNRNGDSPLHLAALHPECNVVLINKLLDMGASLNVDNNYGQTPLHIFIQNKHSLDIIKLVLDNGALVNVFDNFHYSPLHYVLHDFECNPNIVRLLLERGSDVNECSEDEEQPLHLAATACNLEVINILFEYEADVNALDRDYFSPLHYALNSFKCNINTIKLLLEKGADIFLINGHGQQALHAAANKCNADIVRLVLESGADVNSADGGINQPALDQALNAFHSDVEVVKVLLERGADTQLVNENGEQILHWVVGRFKPDIVKLLLDHGAQINALDTRGKSPLHFALNSAECDPDVIKLLINEGANINLADDIGQQPLHLAAFYWDSCTIELLLDHGASADVINSLGYTPLFNTIYHQNDDCSFSMQKLLLQSGARVCRGFSPMEAVVEKLNTKDVKASTEKFSKVLQCTKLLLKYALLEGPMLDFMKISIDSQIAVCLLNYGRECLSELSSKYIGLGNNLRQFIIQQRGGNHRDVNKILNLLSKNQYLIYKEVIGDLLTKRQLEEKLLEQIKIISKNKSMINLNYECLCNIIKYVCDHDDRLNLALAFHTCC